MTDYDQTGWEIGDAAAAQSWALAMCFSTHDAVAWIYLPPSSPTVGTTESDMSVPERPKRPASRSIRRSLRQFARPLRHD